MNCGAKPRLARVTVLSCCVWMTLHAAQVGAEMHLDADVGGEHSDNIGRVADNEESDTIGTASLLIGIDEVRPRLEARVDGDLQYRHYFDGTYDNEVVGGLSSYLAWSILPERFIWVVEDNYGQIAAERALPDTPTNRQDFNYFTTGPELHLPLGARGFTEITARWSDVYYEDVSDESGAPVTTVANEGSENIEGSVALGRLLSEETRLSLNASVEDIEYDDEQTNDFRVTAAFLHYETLGSRTELSVDAGYTEAETNDDSSGGPLLRLNVSREITSRSTVSLEAGSEFADTATAFRLDQVAGGVSGESEDAIASNDVFRTTYAYLRFGTERERTSFEFGINGRAERHEDETDLDRDIVGVTFDVLRSLTPRLDFDLRGAYDKENYVESDSSFDEWSVGAGLSWRMTSRLSLRITVDHFEGSSDVEFGAPGGSGTGARDYEENRAFLGLRYSTGR